MSLCTHGVQTGEGYECSSCVTSPTFAEQLDTHLQRLAADRPTPVTPAEERTEKDPWGNADCWCVDPDRPHYRGTGLCIAAGMVPATLRGVSDVQAEVLAEVQALRLEIQQYGVQACRNGPGPMLSEAFMELDARLDRIASAVRRGEQR